MIQKALQYLVGLKENKTYTINGKTYSDNQLYVIGDEQYHRKNISFGSLDAIVKMIKAEIADYTYENDPLINRIDPLFIHVKDHKNVEVFTRPDSREVRTWPYSAECCDADFREGWREQNKAIIEIKSRFLPTADSEYLLSLISRINNDEGIKSEDNGVSQNVIVKKGVSLATSEVVKPRLTLQPFRTFREVPQPESEFILRLNENGEIGLFEADGGIWKMEAKDSIKKYFLDHLQEEIQSGKIVVMV